MTGIPSESCDFLTRADGVVLAYRHSPPRDASLPTVVFLSGYRSDMDGTKAVFLEARRVAQGQGFLRFDYRGHGRSGATFEEGCIGDWLDDALEMIDRATSGPLILVGSSMGGWIALLAALARPERVAGLVGIAAAPDFSEELMWAAFDAETRDALMRDGIIQLPNPYGETTTPVTRRLIEDGRERLIMGGPIGYAGPVRLLHGREDPDVPWRTALRLADALISPDVDVILTKNGDHRLSTPEDLARLDRVVAGLTDQIAAST